MCWFRRTTNNYFVYFFVLFAFACDNKSIPPDTLSWTNDIQPIILRRCGECHRPGGEAPFSLLSYNEVRSRANRIRFVLEHNIMPPWPADTAYSRFLYEKIITLREKRMILDWIGAGSVSDEKNEIQKITDLHAGIQKKRGPDACIGVPQPVELLGNGKDAFMLVKFPYKLPCDTWLDYVRFIPHQKKWVHHVNGHLIHFDSRRKIPDYFKGTPWHREVRDSLRDIYKSMNLSYGDGKNPEFPVLTTNVVYYLPGYFPLRYPEWIGGWKLSKHGVFLMNNLHYGPSPNPVKDSSYLELYFRKSKPLRPLRELQMGTLGISDILPPLYIPAGEIKTFTTQARVESKISMLSVNPHMHLLGKSFHAFAIRPGGDTIPLIYIPRWDFRWQYYYTYPRPVVLDAGTKIVVFASFDNTSNNPFNPNFPPKDVSEGSGNESMRTTDEMLQFIFTFVPYEEGDEYKSLEIKE